MRVEVELGFKELPAARRHELVEESLVRDAGGFGCAVIHERVFLDFSPKATGDREDLPLLGTAGFDF